MTEIDVDLPTLDTWLPSRRWFSGKGRGSAELEVIDVAPLASATGPWLVTVEAVHDDRGAPQRWLLVLGKVRRRSPVALGTVAGHTVAEVEDHPVVATALLDAVRAGTTTPTDSGGTVTARPVGPLPQPAPTVRPMAVEQSNTSVVIGGEVVVKIIRHLEDGPNPDVEIGEALAGSSNDCSPPLLGAIVGDDDTAMVVVSRFVAGTRDGWALAVEEAAGTADHGLRAGMAGLGRVTAELHANLRQVLPTQEAGPSAAAAWREAMDGELDITMRIVGDHDPSVVPALTQAVQHVVATAPEEMGLLQRVHGDYHLGQVLRDGDGRWWILDFEGEPGRPVAERRRPANPARDVAGMLRSFDYARAAAERQGRDAAEAAAWAADARAAFLEGYGADASQWLRPFEVEKLLYEVRYEAANRPDWLPIPLGALGAVTNTGIDEETTVSDESKPTSIFPLPPAGASASSAVPPVDEDAPPVSASSAEPAPPTHVATVGDAAALAAGTAAEPHRMLGFHAEGDGWVVRAWRPGAASVSYLATSDAEPVACTEPVNGIFEARVADTPTVGQYRLRISYPDGGSYDLVDPYSFPPTLGEVDMHLMQEGRHEQAWTVMGANERTIEGITGVAFSLWAPNARAVRIVGDFNSWDSTLHPMRSLGSSGIWELFLPDVGHGAFYKYELVTADGRTVTRADPWAKWSDVPPGTASRVFTSSNVPSTVKRPTTDHLTSPMSTYEVHLGSWRHHDGVALSYREVAPQLAEYCTQMGFTHVEFLPVAEHPFGGSWGYQVTGQFAPTSRFGSPDDFRFLVDTLHEHGISVIVDWVPAHFPKDEWALRRFDGTALYEHEDPRLGEHPDWGTMVFNYGRTEVKNFLMASALYWIEVLCVDGLRVDAVASMLYLDYSRKADEWIPNEHGGRENLRAVELLQEVNATVYKRNPGTVTIAEESTAWPGVSRPTHLGGLGFGFKWNMGWMHDTLSYFAKDPIHRKWHHNQLTFGMMYAFSENFVLPLSHDEVVHGKGSLLTKMPGDRWRQFANVRALYGWMWGHPGKKLLFMGGEFAQEREWSEDRQLDWYLLAEEGHSGVQRMVADLNAAYRAHPAMWRRDADHEGFEWIDANNADDNLLMFLRRGLEGDPEVAVIANLSPEPRHGVRVGLPREGQWDEVLNTDSEVYGGSNVGNLGGVHAGPVAWHGQPASAEVSCPPLAVVWLRAPS